MRRHALIAVVIASISVVHSPLGGNFPITFARGAPEVCAR
jgi:hypothetical protein